MKTLIFQSFHDIAEERHVILKDINLKRSSFITNCGANLSWWHRAYPIGATKSGPFYERTPSLSRKYLTNMKNFARQNIYLFWPAASDEDKV